MFGRDVYEYTCIFQLNQLKYIFVWIQVLLIITLTDIYVFYRKVKKYDKPKSMDKTIKSKDNDS